MSARSEGTAAPAIRRILVALDASTHSLAALETAAGLAARLEAELVGLFVEDINLLRAAELPFARETSFYSSSLRPLERGELEQGVNIVDLLVRAKLCSSKGEARRLVSQGGAYLDGENVDSIEFLLDRRYADRKEILLRAGKKRYFRFLIE